MRQQVANPKVAVLGHVYACDEQFDSSATKRMLRVGQVFGSFGAAERTDATPAGIESQTPPP
eukprot:3436158-Rhodomonas_salina.1